MKAATEHPAFGRAVAALHAGRSREAEDLFKLVLTERPKHLTALNLLSVLLTRHGRFADAEIYLCRALQVDLSLGRNPAELCDRVASFAPAGGGTRTVQPSSAHQSQ